MTITDSSTLLPASLKVQETPFSAIPVIDFGPMLGDDPAARRTVADTIRDAAIRVGFFYIRNHGVSDAMVRDIFAIAARFFALPIDRKMAVAMKDMGFELGGYTPLLGENTDTAYGSGDMHEGYDMSLPGMSPAGARPTHADPWPAGLPAFRATMERYGEEMLVLGGRLFAAFALALDLPEDYFDPLITNPTGAVRVLHYPSQGADIREAQIGIGAHSDYEALTILAQDDVPALQVRNSAGEWISAPPVPGAFVVNIGDMFERWSNDLFSSTVHRAVNVTGRARYSVPFFLGVNYAAVIETLPNCVSAGRPSKYDPIVAGEYLLMRLEDSFAAAAHD